MLGEMVGTIITNKAQPSKGEQFGYKIAPLGDVNHDGLADWLIGHKRIDSLMIWGTARLIPEEFLLYTGVRNGLPSTESGVRIGPTELFCQSDFLAVGDFDGDGHRDIVMSAIVYEDTIFNANHGGSLTYVSVYWGNGSGHYSNNDTTRLDGSAAAWIDHGFGTAGDLTGDGVDDLAIYFPYGVAQGRQGRVNVPRLHVFNGGSGRRWGRNGIPASADMNWWSSDHFGSESTDLRIFDQDRDGTIDLSVIDVIENGGMGITSRVAVLYGSADRPSFDTSDMQQVDLTTADGKNTAFIDVTGDGYEELVMSCGYVDNVFRVFAGRKGQRLLDQYGSGKDEPIAGHGWWKRPWLEVSQPHVLHDGWFPVWRFGAPDLGDGNLDGIRDVWTYSEPFLLCYTTGEYFDQWVDGYIRVDDLWAMANLGDIDGSGQETIALHFDQIPRRPIEPFPGGVRFIKARRDLPTKHLDAPLRLPHDPVRVSSEQEIMLDEQLVIRRESGTRHVTIGLSRHAGDSDCRIDVVNQIGERAATLELSPAMTKQTIELARGLYFVRISDVPGSPVHRIVID